MRVALVNTNRVKPPIAPIGLDYVADELCAAGHEVETLDLCWEEDWTAAVARFFVGPDFDLVGLTLRNTDDCAFTSRQSFLEEFTAMVSAVRRMTAAPIVLGGVGFSVMPHEILTSCPADAGICGDGEVSLVELAETMAENRPWHAVTNLLWRSGDGWRRNRSSKPRLTSLHPRSRSWFDNRRYFREGGQAGLETKRGCTGNCVYCVDPVAKGDAVRVLPPPLVVDEIEKLLDQGIDHIHTCDSEFNLPESHASDVCDEIVRRGLGGRLRWYAYCSPRPFSRELAERMRRAGCAGINFGVDNGAPDMLKRLRRSFGPEDIMNAARWCKGAGIVVMLDLLLGSPGESRESLVTTIDLMKRSGADRVGVALGVRVYPGTALSGLVQQEELRTGLVGGTDPRDPSFFLEPAVAPFAFELLDELVGNDERFFFFDPSRPQRNYNYNANQRLLEAIQNGYRGAYWDILRRCAESP